MLSPARLFFASQPGLGPLPRVAATALLGTLLAPQHALAQAPPTQAFPQPVPAETAPPPQPAPIQTQPQPVPPEAVPPAPAQQPLPPPNQPAPQQPAQTQPAVYPEAVPQQYPPYAQDLPPQAPPPRPAPAPNAQSPTYASEPPVPPPPAPPKAGDGFAIPDWSLRVDPLNWLIFGRLGVEIEVEALEWLTFEAVPLFVVSEQPPAFNNVDQLFQEADWAGPLAGTTLSAGFWLSGDSFNGNVIRTGIGLYGYRHRAEVDGIEVDSVKETQNRLFVMLGSHRTWGYFTLAGGFGLEYELNDDRRCVELIGNTYGASTTDCDNDQLELSLNGLPNPRPDVANLRGGLHPIYFAFRFSLGVAID